MLYRNLIGAMALVATGLTGGAQAEDMSKLPDWSGQWKNTSGIQWDQTKPLGRAQQAPLTPEYQARYEANLADQAAGGLGDDPTGQCIPHGMPRVMTVVYPMEVVITPKTTYILTDYTIPRRVFTDGRDWPTEMDQNFNGTSIGRWTDPDGDGRYTALEVETRGFKGPRTFEASGLRLHDDNQSVIRERFSLDPAARNFLLDQITVIDHALTRPWTVTKRYRHEPDPSPIWHFNDCAEDNHHVVLGKDSYFITSDGMLMPTKKGQKPPDLRYFPTAGK
ncbi:MAG TPA: hypothetical protein VGI22_06680 [Xanthobacteraceae bacterium]|jgi:hypothetical protein